MLLRAVTIENEQIPSLSLRASRCPGTAVQRPPLGAGCCTRGIHVAWLDGLLRDLPVRGRCARVGVARHRAGLARFRGQRVAESTVLVSRLLRRSRTTGRSLLAGSAGPAGRTQHGGEHCEHLCRGSPVTCRPACHARFSRSAADQPDRRTCAYRNLAGRTEGRTTHAYLSRSCGAGAAAVACRSAPTAGAGLVSRTKRIAGAYRWRGGNGLRCVAQDEFAEPLPHRGSHGVLASHSVIAAWPP